MKPTEKNMFGQPSWQMSTDEIELYITKKGGHIAPVTFYKNSKNPANPYHVAPWHEEKEKAEPAIIEVLRGDFFCMPFGSDSTYKKEVHIVHGETANNAWTFENLEDRGGVLDLSLSLKTKVRAGSVTKNVMLKQSQNVVYTKHVIDGFKGLTTVGHHATLAPPDKEGAMKISTAPIRFGLTSARTDAALYAGNGEYSSIASGKRFTSLSKVPTVWKDNPSADCSSFPARKGFVDIISVYQKPGKNPGWTAAVFTDQGFLWFSLKDTSALPTTLMWMENRGRHGAPWSGRNLCIGLEDICSYMAEGLAGSAKPNPVSDEGIPTVVNLAGTKPYAVNYIQGVASVQKGFDKVKTIAFGKDEITFTSESGKTAETSVNWNFIFSGDLV